MAYVYINVIANRVYQNRNGLQLAEITAPGTPPSGLGHLYAKTDGKLYWKNDSGTETDLIAGGAGAVTSVSGTLNRVTSSGGVTPVIDIAATYVGQTSITTLGTVSTGTWSATAIAAAKGGTGIDTSGSTGFPEISAGVWSVKTAANFVADLGIGFVGTPVQLTAQAASIAATTAYTTPAADGWYRMNIVLTITQAATSSSDLIFGFRFTNAVDNVVKTWPPASVSNINRTIANTTGTVITYTGLMYVKQSTAIQYSTSYTSVGATPMQYDLNLIIEKIK